MVNLITVLMLQAFTIYAQHTLMVKVSPDGRPGVLLAVGSRIGPVFVFHSRSGPSGVLPFWGVCYEQAYETEGPWVPATVATVDDNRDGITDLLIVPQKGDGPQALILGTGLQFCR